MSKQEIVEEVEEKTEEEARAEFELEDLKKFYNYFYANTTATAMSKYTVTETEKDPETGQDVTYEYELDRYKVETISYDTNNDGAGDTNRTKIGEGLILENSGVYKAEIEETYTSDANGKYADAAIVDSCTEAILNDIIEELKNQMSTWTIKGMDGMDSDEKKVEFETKYKYQLYGIASFLFEHGGINPVTNDSTGVIAAYKNFCSAKGPGYIDTNYFKKSPADAPSEYTSYTSGAKFSDLRDADQNEENGTLKAFKDKFLGYDDDSANDFNKVDCDWRLFLRGVFSSGSASTSASDPYWQEFVYVP